MITQKAISLKIDTKLLEDLDAEARLGWKKRNAHINEAIRLYLLIKDKRRFIRLNPSIAYQRQQILELLGELVPESNAIFRS